MKRAGFTFIELLVSISIILFITGGVVASYNTFNDKQKVRQAVYGLKTNLRLAQTMAIAGNKPTGCVSLDGYVVTFDSSASYSVQAKCSGSLTGEIKLYTLPSGLSFSEISFPQSIIFYSLSRGASSNFSVGIAGRLGAEYIYVSESGSIEDSLISPTPGPATATPTATSTSTPTSTNTPTLTNTPTPTLSPTSTNTPTPSPQYLVVLNSNSGESCNAICSEYGRTCIDVGANASGTDNRDYIYAGGCNRQVITCVSTMTIQGNICYGNATYWTNCKCQ